MNSFTQLTPFIPPSCTNATQALRHALLCMGVPVCICASTRSLLFLCSPALPTATAYRQILSLPFSMVYLPVLAQHNSELWELWFVCCVKVLSFALSCCQYSLLWGTRQPLPFFQWLRKARRFIPGKFAGRLGFFWPQALFTSVSSNEFILSYRKYYLYCQ